VTDKWGWGGVQSLGAGGWLLSSLITASTDKKTSAHPSSAGQDIKPWMGYKECELNMEQFL